ncbi:MAG: hypothetical protein ND866_20385 [Pyrinomonadaceae bacterium]|nr:hypothetical protein [Pyrinomonadaceae bacterium]
MKVMVLTVPYGWIGALWGVLIWAEAALFLWQDHSTVWLLDNPISMVLWLTPDPIQHTELQVRWDWLETVPSRPALDGWLTAGQVSRRSGTRAHSNFATEEVSI